MLPGTKASEKRTDRNGLSQHERGRAYFTSISFTAGVSIALIVPVWVRLRFCLVVFLVRMWLLKACFLFTLPVPVSVKRFLAAATVFIFGIIEII